MSGVIFWVPINFGTEMLREIKYLESLKQNTIKNVLIKKLPTTK